MDQGFVVQDNCTFEFFPGMIVLAGRIVCLGGVELTVNKLIEYVSGSGENAMVQTQKFSYHANIVNGPNILRYDSPVPHRDFHHKHLFDTFGSNEELEVLEITTEDAVPTLTDVLVELQEWYWQNLERIKAL